MRAVGVLFRSAQVLRVALSSNWLAYACSKRFSSPSPKSSLSNVRVLIGCRNLAQNPLFLSGYFSILDGVNVSEFV